MWFNEIMIEVKELYICPLCKGEGSPHKCFCNGTGFIEKPLDINEDIQKRLELESELKELEEKLQKTRLERNAFICWYRDSIKNGVPAPAVDRAVNEILEEANRKYKALYDNKKAGKPF